MNVYELYYMYHSGSDEALELLFQLYHKEVERAARRHHIKGFLRMDAYDLQQIAHLQLVEALNSYREEKNIPFVSYYMLIVRHALINVKRSMFTYDKSLEHQTISLDQSVSEHNATYISEYIASNYPDYQADYLLRQKELYGIVQNMLEGLNSVEQKIFSMRNAGYRYREIAEYLQISEKKVDNTLAKIRNANYLKELKDFTCKK